MCLTCFPSYLTKDAAQWLERRNSNPKTLGSIPWRSRVRGSFSIPPSQLLRRIVCASPSFVCTARTHICAHVKDPTSICRKRVGFTAGGMVTQSTASIKLRIRYGTTKNSTTSITSRFETIKRRYDFGHCFIFIYRERFSI